MDCSRYNKLADQSQLLVRSFQFYPALLVPSLCVISAHASNYFLRKTISTSFLLGPYAISISCLPLVLYCSYVVGLWLVVIIGLPRAVCIFGRMKDEVRYWIAFLSYFCIRWWRKYYCSRFSLKGLISSNLLVFGVIANTLYKLFVFGECYPLYSAVIYLFSRHYLLDEILNGFSWLGVTSHIGAVSIDVIFLSARVHFRYPLGSPHRADLIKLGNWF